MKKEERLADVEKKFKTNYSCYRASAKEAEWLITELKSAWSRQQVLREALEKYTDINNWEFDNDIPSWAWINETFGPEAAREALAKADETEI